MLFLEQCQAPCYSKSSHFIICITHYMQQKHDSAFYQDDAGYLMLDIAESTRSEILKHPDFGELPSTCSGPEPAEGSRVVSRIKYPGSRNIANNFHRNALSQIKRFFNLRLKIYPAAGCVESGGYTEVGNHHATGLILRFTVVIAFAEDKYGNQIYFEQCCHRWSYFCRAHPFLVYLCVS